jgi:hypothetical protein
MRTAIMPPDSDGQDSGSVHMLLRLPQSVWDTLSDLAERRHCNRRDVLQDAIVAGLLQLQTEAIGSDLIKAVRPASVYGLMKLPMLLVNREGDDGPGLSLRERTS